MSTLSSHAVIHLQHPSVQKNHLRQTAFLNALEFARIILKSFGFNVV